MNYTLSVDLIYISIIVCAYNEEKLLNKCIESLISQSYQHNKYEIIIVDDESTDKTGQIAKSWVSRFVKGRVPQINYIRIKHGGLSIARNTGVRHARGDILAFVDSDAIANRDWLSEITKPFRYDNADFVGGRIELLNSDSKVAQLSQLTRHKQLFGPNIFMNNLIGCNMAFRKEVFNSIGGFYENFTSRGDETSLYDKIKDSFQYKPAPSAVVYHERPEKLLNWIKTEWESAILWGIKRKIGPRLTIVTMALSLERLFILFMPIAIFLSLFNSLWLPASFVSSLAFIRRLFIHHAGRSILKGLISHYGGLKACIIVVIYSYISYLLLITGNLAGMWIYRNKTLIPPMTTQSNVLEKCIY